MPPSIAEQQQDVSRLQNIKRLAHLADERWASKSSFLEKPSDQPKPATAPKDPRADAGATKAEKQRGIESVVEIGAETAGVSKGGGPRERWQPETWTPRPAATRR
jgi:NADH dehydrogenase [ubiquinone] 1 alpha subcomplex assembly factor 2